MELFWILSCLTTTRFLSIQISTCSISLVPASILILSWGTHGLRLHKGTCSVSKWRSSSSLKTPRLTIVPPCAEGPILTCATWTQPRGEEVQVTGPLTLDHSAFLLVFQTVVNGLLMFLCFHPLGILTVFKEPYSTYLNTRNYRKLGAGP